MIRIANIASPVPIDFDLMMTVPRVLFVISLVTLALLAVSALVFRETFSGSRCESRVLSVLVALVSGIVIFGVLLVAAAAVTWTNHEASVQLWIQDEYSVIISDETVDGTSWVTGEQFVASYRGDAEVFSLRVEGDSYVLLESSGKPVEVRAPRGYSRG